MKNFLEKQKKVCSSKKNLGASSAPTRPIMAAEISEIFKFRPKSRFWPILASNQPLGTFFSPFRGHRAPKYSQLHKKIFGSTLGYFRCGPNFFGHPAPPHPHFRPQKFLHQKSQFWAKMGWWRNFCGRKYGLWVRGGRKFFGPHRKYPKVFPKKILRCWPYFGALWSRKSENGPKKPSNS